MRENDLSGLGRLASVARGLKEVRRKGWVDRGVVEAESVADHSFGVAILAWAVARSRGLDADRAMKMALFHDLAESVVGDETPFDTLLERATRDGKTLPRSRFDTPAPDEPERRASRHAREAAALADLASDLPGEIGQELLELCRDYADQGSEEARLVKQLDRVETLLQAEQYAAAVPGLPIGSFRADVASHPETRRLADLLRSR